MRIGAKMYPVNRSDTFALLQTGFFSRGRYQRSSLRSASSPNITEPGVNMFKFFEKVNIKISDSMRMSISSAIGTF